MLHVTLHFHILKTCETPIHVASSSLFFGAPPAAQQNKHALPLLESTENCSHCQTAKQCFNKEETICLPFLKLPHHIDPPNLCFHNSKHFGYAPHVYPVPQKQSNDSAELDTLMLPIVVEMSSEVDVGIPRRIPLVGICIPCMLSRVLSHFCFRHYEGTPKCCGPLVSKQQ